MTLPRNEKQTRKPPCTICPTEGAIRADGETWLCVTHDAEWCRHVDELVAAGRWTEWAAVFGPWLAEQRKRSAA